MTRELTPQERAKPYAKYYDKTPVRPEPSRYDVLKQPIPADRALPPDRLNDLLLPGYLDVESGYCQLENGSVFVANKTDMPGVTIDMINWWFAWHGLEDLRYMLWYPQDHYSIRVDAASRKKILDPATPMTAKFQGITHFVRENTGQLEDIEINFLSPEDYGFDMTRWPADNSTTLVAANGRSKAVGAPDDAPKAPAMMCHFVRRTDAGVEMRTRFWMGWQVMDKKPVYLLPQNIRIPVEAGAALLKHNIEEYTNLAHLLPTLYREMDGKIE